jgi:hypothetical protein
MTVTKAPAGLGTAGRRLWRAAVAAFEFSGPELEVLRTLCTTVDELARIETGLSETNSLIVRGSTGQPRAHPLLEEARRHRAIVARLVAALDLPEPMAAPSLNVTRIGRPKGADRGTTPPRTGTYRCD